MVGDSECSTRRPSLLVSNATPFASRKALQKKMFWKSLGIWLQPVVYTVQYKPIKVIIADVVNRLLGTINDDATLVA